MLRLDSHLALLCLSCCLYANPLNISVYNIPPSIRGNMASLMYFSVCLKGLYDSFQDYFVTSYFPQHICCERSATTMAMQDIVASILCVRAAKTASQLEELNYISFPYSSSWRSTLGCAAVKIPIKVPFCLQMFVRTHYLNHFQIVPPAVCFLSLVKKRSDELKACGLSLRSSVFV